MKSMSVLTRVATTGALILSALATELLAGQPPTPKPYRQEDVSYDNAKGGVHLAGTLTIPEGNGPFPAVLLITGAGPQDRDESIGPLKPFAVTADALACAGVASLRVDDRGTGQSTGDWLRVNYEGDSDDVRCGLAYLKGRPEIDGRRIGLLGHSEGGIIAAKVAAQSPDVAFIVLLAAGSNPDGVIRIVPGMNHIFQKCETGDPSEFFQIQGCMDGEVLKIISDWILQRRPKA